MNYVDYIASNLQIMLGKPVMKRTRITVAFVLKKLSEGATVPQLIEAYPALTETSIQAVLAYAADVVGNEAVISVV